MDLQVIKIYLSDSTRLVLDDRVLEYLRGLKKLAVEKDDQDEAKEIWCLEQVFKVWKHYLNAYNNLVEGQYHAAWGEFDRADIELSFLAKHFDISNNTYNLKFISDYIRRFQKLFPYRIFMSRESVIKKERCSICNTVVGLRGGCGHRTGEIYDGEMCFRLVEDVEFLAMALVENPEDKYTMLFPEGKEYNYEMLEMLMKYINNPYEKWELDILKELSPEYKNVGRNSLCPCGSEVKYKKCCYQTGKDKHDHYRITFLDKEKPFEVPKKNIWTWKN